jgi:hypothetical protein
MQDNEAIFFGNARRFSTYKGYSDTLEFVETFDQNSERD